MPKTLGELPLSFLGANSKPKNVEVKTAYSRARFSQQPTPIHDYINFKRMSGNEIILNLENHDNFATSELLGGLLELAKRDRDFKYNWNNHPVTAHAITDLKQRIGAMNAKGVLQSAKILDGLQILDQ